MIVRKAAACAVLAAMPLAAACTDGTVAMGAPALSSSASTEAMMMPRHLVLFTSERVPADVVPRIERLGGTLESAIDQIGVLVATGLTSEAVAELARHDGILFIEESTVAPDAMPLIGTLDHADAELPAAMTLDSESPATAELYHRQWNLRAVHADVAWAAGHIGSRSTVVAILDTGLDYLHPELEGLVDLERSRSFAPEDDPIIAERFPGRLPISDLRFHGTAVASVVGTNAVRLAGMNRHVTFLAVKIWNRSGQGAIDRLIAGIVYAADQGADVINVSGNYTFDKHERPGLVAAVQRAVNYAFRNGVVIVAASGNDARDLDHSGNLVRLPCQAAHALCVHATAPAGAGGLDGPWHDVDALGGYSGFGRSTIDVAAPGGGGAVGSGRRVLVACSGTTTETSPAPACVAAPGVAIAQPGATSFAVPHVTGAVALLVSHMGKDRPSHVLARLLQSADDLGEPGRDPFYGHGRINVARALGIE